VGYGLTQECRVVGGLLGIKGCGGGEVELKEVVGDVIKGEASPDTPEVEVRFPSAVVLREEGGGDTRNKGKAKRTDFDKRLFAQEDKTKGQTKIREGTRRVCGFVTGEEEAGPPVGDEGSPWEDSVFCTGAQSKEIEAAGVRGDGSGEGDGGPKDAFRRAFCGISGEGESRED
jgi:hypothetical protein